MNRYNLYGDLLFETIKVVDRKAQHPRRHFSRLKKGAELLSLECEALDYAGFMNEIEKSIENYCKLHDAGINNMLRLRFVLYRQSGGYYSPDTNASHFYAECAPYIPATVGDIVKAGIYIKQAKAPGPLSNMKTGNALVYVLAAIHAKEQGWHDSLIVNTNGHIIEATSSNLFWFSNGQWFTPPLSDGCVAGIMREVFMEEHEVTEVPCTAVVLEDADRIVITNALHGYRELDLVRA